MFLSYVSDMYLSYVHTHINQARCSTDFFNVKLSKLSITVDNIPQFLGNSY